MNIDAIHDFALSLPQAEASLPFGPDVMVYKAKGKMFLLVSLSSTPLQFNVKCLPEIAVELREQYPNTVLPGYHMNKKHWNTIIIDGVLSSKQLKQFIEDSYHLVFK
jgi:predicted DNA-binding protein (MmcQ/YjbR family)